MACLKTRRWIADAEAGLQKIYYKENIVATIWALADWFSPADIEAPTLEWVAFLDRKTGKQLKIDDVPEIIFSEVMRDVDLAVSVAHAGGVDPETSHSTMEMRAAILSFTLPLFRLSNVEIKDRHAIIAGELAQYSVHLGSGVVHQIGGTMLSVLPVHSQHRGKLFCPLWTKIPRPWRLSPRCCSLLKTGRLKIPLFWNKFRDNDDTLRCELQRRVFFKVIGPMGEVGDNHVLVFLQPVWYNKRIKSLLAPTGANPGFSLIMSITPAIRFLEQLLFGDCVLFLLKKYWRYVFNMRTLTTVALLLLVENG